MTYCSSDRTWRSVSDNVGFGSVQRLLFVQRSACEAALFLAFLSVLSTATAGVAAESGALPSWRDSASRSRIVEFVAEVTRDGGESYVPPAERVAVFDNDGTLWAEQPIYFQVLFAADEARAQLRDDPSLANQTPYKEIAENDLGALAAGGHEALFSLIFGTHSGMSSASFSDTVSAWIASARHPSTNRPYTSMVYQPMLELLDYLRGHDFTVYIVSGGGTEFMRVWAEDVYGIAPQHVIGSRVALEYQEGEPPVLLRQAKLAHLDDGPGKPVSIQQIIGRRPLLAGGNSDGDFEMLRWTTSGSGARLGLIVRHTDSEREWAYDRDSKIGRLDRGLDAAEENDWVVIDMKNDWATVFPAVQSP